MAAGSRAEHTTALDVFWILGVVCNQGRTGFRLFSGGGFWWVSGAAAIGVLVAGGCSTAPLVRQPSPLPAGRSS